MKIKCIPEDFVVSEKSEFKFLPRGDYSVYLLEKKGLETLELIDRIAYLNRIPKKEVGFAGIKDKHAHTFQYISIPSRFKIKELKDRGYSVKFVGFLNSPIGVGGLSGNEFKVVVRDLSFEETKAVSSSVKDVLSFGVINYFDSQRFGGVYEGEFVAKYLAKKDYESAVKLFLLGQYMSLKKSELSANRQFLIDNWKSFGMLSLKLSYLSFLQDEFNRTQSWKATFKRIPSKLREMIVLSFQSFLWNECVSCFVRSRGEFFKVPYAVGEFSFPKFKLGKCVFPMVGRNFNASSENLKIIEEVLKVQDLSFEEIDDISKSGSFLRSQNREVVVFPKNLKFSVLKDEIYSKPNFERFKVVLEFGLPKGSYATIVVKSIFKK